MTLAPEPYLSACLDVLGHAALFVRFIAWGGEQTAGLPPEESARIAGLMDAVHNLPWLINSWEKCDEPWLRRSLEHFDQRFDIGEKLLDIYTRRLRGPRGDQ